jgi:hypothetical protein
LKREKEIVAREESVTGIPPVVVVEPVDVEVPTLAIPVVVPVGIETEYICAQNHPRHHPSNTLWIV